MALEIRKCQLRSIRRQAKLTQAELCIRLRFLGIDVKPAYISNLENNRGTPASHLLLKALSIIFDRPMDDFYTYRW
ncbi:helix-turn-helix transcriptional regulator [Paenibacillus medicaginis]|uniref:Helix-turn-helix transcriptional regulator n=1 Tax=Paenibacillus medicaginis TaxID=1470560 RepID=A0ABV5C0S3_9BACL